MTIVVQVIKQLLIDTLNNRIEDLNSKIQSKESGGWTLFNAAPYNIELARSKLVLLRAFRKFINDMPEKENDLSSVQFLCNCVSQFKKKIEAESHKHHQPPKSTEGTMDILLQFITNFYDKAKSLGLLDNSDFTGDFAHFTKVVNLYHAKRILIDCNKGVIKGFIEDPHVTSINVFHQELDTSVDNIFLFACRNLAGQQKEESNYEAIKNEMGKFCIQHLLYEYERIRRSHNLTSFMMLPSYLKDDLLSLAPVSSMTFSEEDIIENDVEILDFPPEITDSLLEHTDIEGYNKRK